ncbi:MAG: 1-acyl-sn-glycerol-3-phosphate acyltransferase [Deltaproteobacteria bacterium]
MIVPQIKFEVLRRSLRFLRPMALRYFRTEGRSMHRIPDGPTILVTSHDGGVLPINGICFGVSWYQKFGETRAFYVLAHELLFKLFPGLTNLLTDSGCISADKGNLDAVLEAGHSVLIFPGAARESFRTYWARRDVDLGGRRGFVSAAIRWNVPITPVASAGGHETLFVLSGGHALARALGVPRLVRSADVLPLLAGIPWGVWFLPFIPQFPLPAKIVNEVLEPVYPSQVIGRTLTPEDADDPAVVYAVFDEVLRRLREGTSKLYDERRWPVIG